MSLRPSLFLVALLATAAASAQAPIAPCVGGVAALPDVGAFPCDGVDLVGYLSVSSFSTPGSPAANGNNDIWGWTDPVTGTEYALVGTYNGVGFVDLSNPAFPRLVGKLPTSNELAPVWRDVKVYADHAFVVADNARDHGVQVFDLTRLRGVEGAPVTFDADAVYQGIRSAHNIVINEETGVAYAVGFRYPQGQREALGLPPSCDAPGFHAINVQDPKNPTFAGCFSDVTYEVGSGTPGYTHDAQCVTYNGPDTDYTGRNICIAANEDAVTVFDVTDLNEVRVVSQAAYPAFAYTHQGWLTEDQRYFLADDELDEQYGLVPTQRTLVFDLSDLDDPEFAFPYDSGLPTIDHNLYVRGRYAFESNYASGLRILDLGEIGEGTLTEVGFFDTYPPDTSVSFDGQWSNYPYFESGLVVANDGAYGLFVLRPTVLQATACEACEALPAGFTLSEPAPNPTRAGARLTLRVGSPQTVRADLYDVAGRAVAPVFDGRVSAGATVELAVPGDGLPAGVYVVRVVGERFEASRRVVITP